MNLDRYRVSGLPSLAKCSGFNLLGRDSPSGKAADTGSAVGRLIELFHRAGDDTSLFDGHVRVVKHEAPAEFPLADMEQVVQTGLMYAQDPRNIGVVVGEYCELEVTAELPPSELDPTNEPITIVGHMDQVREENGQLYVWDTKNGAPDGGDMAYSYALQLAAYAVAATETLGRTVLPGGIIRLAGYRPKKRMRDPETNELRDRLPGEHRVFFHTQWSLEQCRAMLGTPLVKVGLLRSGLILTEPGPHCRWCPADGPHNCGDDIQALFENNPFEDDNEED